MQIPLKYEQILVIVNVLDIWVNDSYYIRDFYFENV